MTELQELYIELLGHESESVREEAVKALLEMLDTEVVDALQENARQNEHPGQLESVWLLGKAEDTQVTETLLELFKSSDPQVREVVAGAFAEIGDVRALQPLIDGLNDESPTVKDAAAIALGELRDSRAIKPLIAKLDEEQIQQVAAWALAMIGDPQAVPPLKQAMLNDEDPSMRGMAARSLGKLAHKDADAAVVEGLDDEDESVLIEVIRVIGERRCLNALSKLETMFETTEYERIKLACSVAMARCGQGNNYLPFLLETLKSDSDWGARLSAIMGLREMNLEQVEAALRAALDDSHWLVQKTAARSLLLMKDKEIYATLDSYLGEEEEDIMQAVIETSFFELLEDDEDEDD